MGPPPDLTFGNDGVSIEPLPAPDGLDVYAEFRWQLLPCRLCRIAWAGAKGRPRAKVRLVNRTVGLVGTGAPVLVRCRRGRLTLDDELRLAEQLRRAGYADVRYESWDTEG